MMLTIPSSLKWLISKRARLTGKIKKAEVAFSKKVQLEQAYIESLKADLQVIDQTIRSHETQLDSDLIFMMKAECAVRQFEHGVVTRAIFASLRQAGLEPRSSSQIALYLCAIAQNNVGNEEFAEICNIVRHRLRALHREGKIEKLQCAQAGSEDFWKIKDWTELSTIGRPKKHPVMASKDQLSDEAIQDVHTTIDARDCA